MHSSNPCNSLGKLRKCGLEGMSRFLLNLLHEPSSHVLPSGLETQVAPQAHEGVFVPKISTVKEHLYFDCLWPKVST